MADPHFKRILLKVSGEVLMGEQAYGIDLPTVQRVAAEIEAVARLGCELCIVIGAGNIFRGVAGAAKGMDRVNADYMGMLGTVMNALAMQDALKALGLDARVMSAIPMPTVCESFTRAEALRHLAQKRIVLFAAGTGSPFFTTDTTAALRAAEMGCDALLKGTSVDGIYAADPKKDAKAERFERIGYGEVLARDLKVMDAAAVALARDNHIPVIVFSIRNPGAVLEVAQGRGRFTLVTDA
ncbi:MAG: UMP kinase [Aestuariivirgaceae bacterium]|nr:UMP kinase [Aestuariivirgaceae bacterium]